MTEADTIAHKEDMVNLPSRVKLEASSMIAKRAASG